MNKTRLFGYFNAVTVFIVFAYFAFTIFFPAFVLFSFHDVASNEHRDILRMRFQHLLDLAVGTACWLHEIFILFTHEFHTKHKFIVYRPV